MSKIDQPTRILIMDDDFHALKWNTALFMRDPRSTVVGECESPDELLAYLDDKGNDRPDVIVIDTEYGADYPDVDALLSTVRKAQEGANLICLSQYGHPKAIRAALDNEAVGFLLKREVRMAVVPAILQALRVENFVISPGIAEKMNELAPLKPLHNIPRWKPNPNLTPQIMKSFWLRVFFGMRASLAAEEMFVETATIERYVNQAYKILPDGWADERYLFDVDLNEISPEDQAFVWFTLPPHTG
jgi:DNA-binding NarL/FixJ family response regulator